MPIVSNPSTLNKLALALKSGRRQIGSNGDGNATVANQEGTSLEMPQSGTQGQSAGGFANGTRLAGYSTPDQGPFRCDHCKFFDPQDKGCRGPNVMKDPQVQKLPDGRGMVDPGGCCSKDYTPSNTKAPGFTAIARPGTVGGMNPGSQPPGQGSNDPLQAPRTTLRAPGSV